MKIGFAGLGQMGAAMARNLAAAGHTVAVWNRSRDKAEALKPDGARVASSPGDVSRDADAVFTMVADDAALEEVVFAENGIAESLARGAIHLSSTTISTALARRLTAEHEKRGQGFLSTPVFGRPDVAAARKLLVIAAGRNELIERVRPLFDAIGRQTFVAGPEPWQANLLKLCGNFTLLSMLETLGEAVAVLRKAGVDASVFMSAINELYASPVYKNYGGMIANNCFEPAGFALTLGLKDARLILRAADECGAPLPIASLVHAQLLAAMANGQAELDWTSVARISARNAGV